MRQNETWLKQFYSDLAANKPFHMSGKFVSSNLRQNFRLLAIKNTLHSASYWTVLTDHVLVPALLCSVTLMRAERLRGVPRFHSQYFSVLQG